MVAQVVVMEEKRTYRTAEGAERSRFTTTPDWLFEYMPKLARGIGWNLLSIILHYQRMCERDRPVAISVHQFCKETGTTKPTVLKGLSDLAKMGLLYEELEQPECRDSAICYALLEEPGQGVVQEEDGKYWVHLLGGWYEVDPARMIQRTGGKETIPPPKNGVGGKETLPGRSRNFTAWGKETLLPPADEVSQEAGARSLESIERKREKTDTNVSGATAPVPAEKPAESSHSHFPGWPSRQENEQEADYWLRTFKDADPKHAKQLLARMAHEKLGVPLDKTTYTRIATMTNQARHSSLMCSYILQASVVPRILGNKLDYLNGIVRRQHPANGKPQRGGYQAEQVDLSKVAGFGQSPDEQARRFVTQSAFESGT